MPTPFTADTHGQFAELSGDHNPLHVDPVASRRTMFGRQLAYGVQAILWTLDQWLASDTAPAGDRLGIARLKASFRAPMYIDEVLELRVAPGKSMQRLDVWGNGVRKMALQVALAKSPSPLIAPQPRFAHHGTPTVREAKDLAGAEGRVLLVLEPATAEALFPTLIRRMEPAQVAMLAGISRMVGMQLPGMHSLDLEFDLAATDDAHLDALEYAAESFDERFSLLTIRVRGPRLAGKVSAALLPPPKRQSSFTEIVSTVRPGEFAGVRALIIGGSRGLGEVAAKTLAAGGADVRLTWHRGATEAAEVVREINAGGGNAQCFAYDAARGSAKLAESLGSFTPALLGYFATPFIFSATAGKFSPELHREFHDIYVDGFASAFEAVASMGSLRGVLYPSTSAIDERPADMAEYTAAKSAGEQRCAELQRIHPDVKFHCPRFRRLATDQTATLAPVAAAAPDEPILLALRQLCEPNK